MTMMAKTVVPFYTGTVSKVAEVSTTRETERIARTTAPGYPRVTHVSEARYPSRDNDVPRF